LSGEDFHNAVAATAAASVAVKGVDENLKVRGKVVRRKSTTPRSVLDLEDDAVLNRRQRSSEETADGVEEESDCAVEPVTAKRQKTAIH
jgi:hypothetical protein